jgi:tripartite-type tricarboxylate transporter receptor subunit TctC
MTSMFRLSICRTLAGLLAALLVTASWAQDWPTRPIRMIVPGAAGASADVLARSMAQVLSRHLGTSIVVENKVGASGTLGADFVAKSPPNGYTLLFGQQDSQTILPLLKKAMPYDAEKDFVPLAKVGDLYLVYATNAKVPAQDMRQFIALAKASPGKMNFGSGGGGGINHLASEMLVQRAGIDLVHVPYKGGTPAATALMAGEIELFSGSYSLLGKSIESGRLRGLAVTSPARLAYLPNVPTMEELGYKGFVVSAWYGAFAPAGLPDAIASRLSSAFIAAVDSPEYRQTLQAVGAEGQALDRAAFTRFLQADQASWKEVIQKGRISLPE